jgi:hypothetical protein
MISHLAKEPVYLTTVISMVFHSPSLVIPDPLSCKTILHLSEEDSNSNQSDIIHGLYLRHEHDIQDEHISRFHAGDIAALQNDIGRELRGLLKLWRVLWDKDTERWIRSHRAGADLDDTQTIESVHLQWIARIAQGLYDELFLLGTAHRCQGYVAFVKARRVAVPLP